MSLTIIRRGTLARALMLLVVPAMAAGAATMELPDDATATAVNALHAPSALLAVDQHRASVVERIVREWGMRLETSGAGIHREHLREMLQSLRADDLLAASLAGTLSGLRDVVAMAVSSAAPHQALRTIQNIGDASQDLVYTPVTPCRLFDTRVSQGGLGTPSLNVRRTYGATAAVANQGGPGGCLAAAGAAVALIQVGTLTPSASGLLQAGPQGATSFPNALILYQAGDQYGTAVAMPLNPANGQFDLVEQSATADLYGDLLGYFRAPVGATLAGNLTLVNSTASAGNIMKGAAPFIHNFGAQNLFVGESAGNFTLSGTDNTGIGFSALSVNATGSSNTAVGRSTMQLNSGGSNNTAVGYSALANNIDGNENIAIGYGAGVSTGSSSFDNIMIGNGGLAADNLTIRIGDANQDKTFVAGIRGTLTGINDAVAVVIDSSGQLGTVSSSRRFKDDIADMDEASTALMNLRPVTFHYKTDQDAAGRTLQYGLIAEEVNEVYPGLIAHSADGRIETVMYQFLPPMLLNEYQKQQRTILAQAQDAARYKAQLAELTERVQKAEALAADVAVLKAALADLQRTRATVAAK